MGETTKNHLKTRTPMRKNVAPQLGLVPQAVNHPHARELARVSEILDKLPQAAELVAKLGPVSRMLGATLRNTANPTRLGRAGMTGEQVLRAGLLKQMHRWSYDDLAFHLSDSTTFRAFCRIGMMETAPKRSALAENIKRVKPETFERVNQLVVVRAKKLRVENGKKVRVAKRIATIVSEAAEGRLEDVREALEEAHAKSKN